MSTPEIISTALLLGAAGSLHCAGMCGPLAFALPVAHDNPYSRLAGGSLYNFGRVLSYTVLGVLVGFAGQWLLAPAWQQYVSVAMGSVILLYLLVPKSVRVHRFGAGRMARLMRTLQARLGRLFRTRKLSGLFLIGILNGLLPCGLVYLALSSSLLAGSAWRGGLFMSFFGLGTYPLMLVAVFGASFLNQQVRLRLSRAVPVFLFLMGVLLVLRGLGLGIPFLSPVLTAPGAGAVSCH